MTRLALSLSLMLLLAGAAGAAALTPTDAGVRRARGRLRPRRRGRGRGLSGRGLVPRPRARRGAERHTGGRALAHGERERTVRCRLPGGAGAARQGLRVQRRLPHPPQDPQVRELRHAAAVRRPVRGRPEALQRQRLGQHALAARRARRRPTAALFAVNTVTGVWNLSEGRKDPNHRTKRMVHGILMAVADAGFVATGVMTPDSEGETRVRGRRRRHQPIDAPRGRADLDGHRHRGLPDDADPLSDHGTPRLRRFRRRVLGRFLRPPPAGLGLRPLPAPRGSHRGRRHRAGGRPPGPRGRPAPGHRLARGSWPRSTRRTASWCPRSPSW